MNGEDLLGTSLRAFEAAGPGHPGGTVEEIEGEYYGESPASGISVVAGLDGVIRTVQLHADGYEEYAGYRGQMPRGIDFTMGRHRIRKVLGAPEASGEAQEIPPFGRQAAWDRFDVGDYVLHVRYTMDESAVELVSLMDPAAVPRPD